ncbi:ABC transporter ATP-binding protein [Adlercreutzia equolifaciens]|uniref:ABC transporter ATP-binding protein n=1 Tax=Adlercreutzia equolifaciens TaxID=446660 RepID=UPI0023AEC282|nr:ABC transporter ATP-binding protein [Adlercreutzia equolifaciens]MDE8701862.1 ABC transporter ATP-binding protein [Adlercreutzia equolifaciens]
MKLEVRDAHCGYEKGKAVQRYVTFSVESGEVCCVLGPNGCGKSTVFKSLLGLLPLQSGKVMVDGENIAKWSPKRLADTMAYVSQSHVPPFPYQVKDVVLLGRINKVGHMGQPTANDYAIVENAMQDMGIYHLRDKVYTDISGGELQLVMIARALAQEPKILVLDEPTAALDYGNVVRVIDKVRSLAEKGYAVVMTTHSPDHAFMCDSSVVLLQKGEPMKFGQAVDIITEKNMKQAYGVNVKIVEFVNTKNEIMRMCAPVF